MRPKLHFLTGSMEERVRRLEQILVTVIACWALSAAAAVLYIAPWKASAQASQGTQSLRVSELVVVDPKGVERVRIGGDLPDAVINGKRIPRGEKVAGVMLYDGSGQERGGYVTFEPSGNVGLTLDTKKRQTVLFAAGPDSGSALVMSSAMGNIDLRSDEDGARMSLIRDGQLVQQQPEVARISDASCKDYKDIVTRSGKDHAVRACRSRFGEKACSACLGN